MTAGSYYSVTITDANGCTFTPPAVTITEPILATSIAATGSSPICEASVLTLSSTPTSSTGGLAYVWSGPNAFAVTTQNASIAITTIAAAGTYMITVKDANNCIATATTAVVINPLPTIYTDLGTGVICSGVASPITLSGSTVGINYKLTSPGYAGSVLVGTGSSALTFTPPANILATYTIEATNTVTLCKVLMTGSIATTNATNPTVTITAQTNISCFGGNNGSVTAVASAGSGAYTYTFNGGVSQPTGEFSGKTAGTYLIVATDANTGCIGSINAMITQPATLPSVTVASSGVTCVGNTVTLTATATGGTGTTYMYNWNGTGFVSTPTLAVTSTSTNTLTAKDVNGCTSSAVSSTMVTFNTPTLPTISGSTTLCSGSTLSLSTSAMGTYAWSGPNAFTSTSASISIANAQVVNAGTYTITVTDANSCVASATANVVINITPTISVTPTTAILSCTTPSTVITASGATNYSWTGTSGFTATTAAATIIAGGTYVVTGIANGCSASASVVVTENKATPTVTVTPTTAILTCLNPTTLITASGASTYSWTDNDGFTATTTGGTLSLAGTYTVTGIGANGCTATANVVVTENKIAPTVTVTPTNAVLTCLTTSTAITASGASTYSWSGTGGFTATTAIANITVGGTYKVIGTGANGCTATAAVTITEDKATPTVSITPTTAIVLTCLTPTATITANGANTYTWSGTGGFTATTAIATINAGGTYMVIGTGSNGCTASATVEVTENKTPPTVTVSASSFILTCLNPTATITASGALTYSWAGTGGYTATTAIASITTAGTYTVIGTNANGCTASVRVALGQSKTQPTISVTPTTAILTCLIPRTTITASGANSSYAWSGTGGFTASTATALITVGGIYTVIGTNGNGCSASASVIITENKVVPTATVTGSGVLCSGSTISLTATGGGTYQWSGPNSFTSTSAAVNIPNATVTNSGTYIVTVTNANGCTALAMATITVNSAIAVPTTQAFTSISSGESITLTATGCSGTLLWFKSSDDSPITMPVSPTTMTSYYAKCEVTTNGVTCTSAKSADIVVTVGIIISIKTGGAWEDPFTWDVGRVPLSTDEVIIDTNHNVIITTLNAVAKKLRYRTNSQVTFGNPATKLTISGL